MTPFDLGLYVLVVLVWGTSWIGMSSQVGVVAPEVSVLWRFVIAFPIMFTWAWAAGRRLRFTGDEHVYFVGMGATMFSFNLIGFYYASLFIPSGLMAVVFSVASIFNLVLSAIFFGQPIHARLVGWGAVGVSGVGLMFAPEILAHEIDRQALTGLMLCVGATLCFCSGNIISAATQKRGIPVLSSTAWGMLYGTGMLLVFALVRSQPLILEWWQPTAPSHAGVLRWVT